VKTKNEKEHNTFVHVVTSCVPGTMVIQKKTRL